MPISPFDIIFMFSTSFTNKKLSVRLLIPAPGKENTSVPYINNQFYIL